MCEVRQHICWQTQNVTGGESDGAPGWKVLCLNCPWLQAALTGWLVALFNTEVELLLWKQQTQGVSPWGRWDRKWTQRCEDLKCKRIKFRLLSAVPVSLPAFKNWGGLKNKTKNYNDGWIRIKNKEWRERIFFLFFDLKSLMSLKTWTGGKSGMHPEDDNQISSWWWMDLLFNAERKSFPLQKSQWTSTEVIEQVEEK